MSSHFFATFKKILSRFRGKSRPFRLTRGGWVFILYTIGVGAGAINTGNNLIYLIFGVFLGIILASGFLSDFSLWNVSVDVGLPDSARAGEPNLLSLSIQNWKKRLPGVSVTVILEGRLRGEPVELKKFFPVLLAGENLQTHVLFIPPGRGWFHLERVKIATRFPFGLLFKWWTIWRSERDGEKSMIVFPRHIGLRDSQTLFRQAGEEQSASDEIKGDGAVLHGVRNYKDSDNPRRIYWKASAKRSWLEDSRAWLVKEMEQEQKESPLLKMPSLSQFQLLNIAETENLIRFAASILYIFSDKGKPARLVFPVKKSGGEEELWRVRPIFPGDETFQSLSFLALFEKEKWNSDETWSRLQPDPECLERNFAGREIDVFTQFEKWMASRDDE